MDHKRITDEMDEQFWGAVSMLQEGLGWDEEKALLWMERPNPLLGGVSPDSMITCGKGEKLIQFIARCLEDTCGKAS